MANNNKNHGHVHDALFKKCLQKIEHAAALIRAYLPKAKLDLIDLRTLKLESSEFLNDGLKFSHADLLFSVKAREDKRAYYILIEHQSTADTWMPFRILEYSVAIMRRHLNNGHKELPLVFPLVVYAGRQSPYPKTTHLLDLFQDPELTKCHLFEPFCLVDLTTIPNVEIANLDEVALVLLALKSCATGGLDNIFEWVEHKCDQISSETFFDVLVYMSKSSKFSDPKELIKRVKSLGKDAKEMAMTIYEQLTQKGIQQGMQQGMQQGREEIACNLIAKGLADDFIADTTGLELQVIHQLKKETVS